MAIQAINLNPFVQSIGCAKGYTPSAKQPQSQELAQTFNFGTANPNAPESRSDTKGQALYCWA